MNALAVRKSERRSEQLLNDLLDSQGWDLRKPPFGDRYVQTEYRDSPALAKALSGASKSGGGSGIPEAILVDSELKPLLLVEAKASYDAIQQATDEAMLYASALVANGFNPLAVGLAGTDAKEFELRVFAHRQDQWVPVTYEGHPINWIPGKVDARRLAVPNSPSEIRPTPPPDYVLAVRANEINRLLREADIKDEYRPTHVAAIMLALWHSKGEIRRQPSYVLRDVNSECRDALLAAGKANLAKSIRVDEANAKLRANTIRIAEILERLNVTVLTAEHDYLGQLYETFFRYTGGNTIGQYFTPRHVTKMMVDVCEASSNDVILDVACGTGGFFVAYMDRLVKDEHLSRTAMVDVIQRRIIGFESEPNTAALCTANMILRGDGSTRICQGDSLTLQDFPVGEASIAVMNPPFPHKNTDTPVERFIERSLEGLQQGGELAVIVPSSLLSKSSKGAWREKILAKNTLTAVCQLPDELFQPFASVTTSIVFLTKGRQHPANRKTVFVRIRHDGLLLKKNARVRRDSEPDQVPAAVDAILNSREEPGFSSARSVSGRNEWSAGAYIESALPDEDELKQAIDVQLRCLASFYARYAAEIMAQRKAIESDEVEIRPYREMLSRQKLANAKRLPKEDGTIGGAFDIYYGMKDLHSRDGMAEGKTLIVSPTESYNGTDGWLEFGTAIEPAFVTVAQTGSIGEAFVQLEPCAVNDDCLLLLPRSHEHGNVAKLVVTAAILRYERWRFNYGRKLTPERIAGFSLLESAALEEWVQTKLVDTMGVISASLSPYQGEEEMESKKEQKTYKADYKGATPEQVTKALLTYRPTKR